MKNTPELLAPAGSLEKLKFAYQYGADAVYAGLPIFSMRKHVNKFTISEIKQGIAYAHNLKKKFYLTCNTTPHDAELKKLPKLLKSLSDDPPDAVVLEDMGVMTQVKKILPKTGIHLSVQAYTVNSASAKWWQQVAQVKRIILARDLSLAEITKIHQAVPRLELEVFVHGAVCMAKSARCFLSLHLSQRDANRGDCAQSCRWQYKLVEEKRPHEYLPLEETAGGIRIFSSKDLCLIEYLAKLKKAGVTSFKIEGRNKNLFYLAIVVRTYQQVLNKKMSIKKSLTELNTLPHRGYSTGFFTGKKLTKKDYQLNSSGLLAHNFLGLVRRYSPAEKKVTLEVRNRIKKEDQGEWLTPDKILPEKISDLENMDKEKITIAHAGQKNMIKIPTKYELPVGTILRKK